MGSCQGVCIMAERRLRTIFPREPAQEPALTEAYSWALEAKPGAMSEAVVRKVV